MSAPRPARPHARADRPRGSVLLMVVAVLALMAIIAVAYTTLGRADRASSSALVRESRLNDHASSIAGYLSGVIADDVVSTYAELRGDGQWTVRREATDAPGASPELASDEQVVLTDGYTRFDPTGTYSGAWTGRDTDRRRPSDPWLASIEPEYIPRNSITPPLAAFDMSLFDEPPSWRAISAFSPDGRFSNLRNLRGQFGARPGFGNFAGVPRMSSDLNLLDNNDADTNVNLITDQPLAQFNSVPADFSVFQYRAFRPMYDAYSPSDPRHINNQWADADGDGFADSRWFELVDAFDPDRIRWILPQDGRARYFIAARAVDLSGLVNINTASDFLYEPTVHTIGGRDLHFPAGLTPADIDLRRLLRMGDMNWVYRSGSSSFGYDAFETAVGVADYSGYDRNVAIDIGQTSYAALRYAINSGEVLASDARSPGEPLLDWNADESSPNTGNPNPLTDFQRARYYDEFGTDPSAAASRQPGTSFHFRAPFGVADELELRTFSGVNDSDHTSPAERVMGGRWNANRSFGPLRENRPRAIEMAGRPDSSTGDASPEALLSVFTDLRHLITTQSGARPIIDNAASPVSANRDSLTSLDFKTDALALLSKIDRSSGNGPTPAQLQELFELYVSALMPYTHETEYPNAWDRSVMASRGLSYGESAELAQRICAHLVANLCDAVDEDLNGAGGYDRCVPTRVALEAVTNAPNNATFFEQANVLSVRDIYRPDVVENRHGGSPRLNIYGIEAQPFVIEVGWTGMFADAPYDPSHTGALGADNDFEDGHMDPMPPLQPNEVFGKITIDEQTIPGNPDFIFEVLAFQVNNPFDHDLQIASGNTISYYFEFANRFFALAEVNDTGNTYSGADVIIPAYETRVFYVLNIKNTTNIIQRMRKAQYTAVNDTPQNIPADYIDQWVTQQFGADAIRIPMVYRKSLNIVSDPSGGGGAPEFVDFFGDTTIPAGSSGEVAQDPIGAVPTSLAQRRNAYLWRVFRPVGAGTDATGDILLDRIKDPRTGRGTLADARAPGPDNEVNDTEAGDDTDSNRSNDKDNTGFAVTKWGAFRRPTGEGYLRGSMPAWAIEIKNDNSFPPSTNLRNVAQDGPVAGIGKRTDYTLTPGVEKRTTLDDLMDLQIGSGVINSRIKARAELKVGNQAMQNQSGKPYYDAAVQIHLGGGRKNPQLFSRAGDFLLPLAIGPSNDPLRGAALPTRVEQLEASWMTLAEALALSCDYYSPPPNDAFTGGLDPLFQLGHTNGTNIRPRLDRGNLVLNDFAPYIDLNDDGAFDPIVDERIGRGVPMAYNIVDMFNTADRWRLDASGNVALRTRSHGGTRARINGLINIQTAPPSVLRMIPMFAPDPNMDSWAVDASSGTPLFDPGAGDIFDFAAMVAAYRDKAILQTRPSQNAATIDQINYRDDNDTDPGSYDGRFAATKIAGIREHPGFKSIGEILALRYNDPTQTNPTRIFENSVDRFVNTSSASRQLKLALESTLVEPDTALGETGPQTDKLINDYDEQLAIANAAFNSITVRSDVFCVWFIVHGYLPSDVENLGPNDPMIPSIARRYVMVVDRSNVVLKGEEPKLLLFQEVPLR